MSRKIEISTDDNQKVEASTPVIISASRATDIPAFYGDWFVNRWKAGYIKWINPFNQKPVYVSFEKARAVVFWTKNPAPMFKHFEFLDREVKNYYFQYTLNDYDKEGFEGNVASVEKRISIFKELSEKIGKERVIWRYDPLILTEDIDVAELLRRVERVGDALHRYTEKLVFSFADIGVYKKVQNNLRGVEYIEFDTRRMEEFARGLQALNKKWNLEISTCSELIDLDAFGITHNKCIDDELMIKLFSEDEPLMDFLGVEIVQPSLFDLMEEPQRKAVKLKDKGQRKECGCIQSKDIGQYNTCPHGCNYCYANTSKDLAEKNYQRSRGNQTRETILP
jgi:DNA repair photolyase